jgi:NOL1/NOP2/sun family putative RNA methylase
MKLPDTFVTSMKSYFEDHPELPSEGFFESFDLPSYRGIRINRLKASLQEDEKILRAIGNPIENVPWCKSGYYSDEKISGNDPYFHAGVFYMQEPSAMLPAEVLCAKPGERILDLCAAPGGKATRIAEGMNGKGIFIANDISYDRTKALLRNIERLGVENAVILSESPERLAARFPLYFDKILIDAPCSGEGMFRRDPSAMKSWEKFGTKTTTTMQKEILDRADAMLRPGGSIVYSTCTFSREEDEGMIEWFIGEHKEYQVIESPTIQGVNVGLTIGPAKGSMRIWPHISNGDGHFCVQLQKSQEGSIDLSEELNSRYKMHQVPRGSLLNAIQVMKIFFSGLLTEKAYEQFLEKIDLGTVLLGNKIHFHPLMPSLYDGLKMIKMGGFPGEIISRGSDLVFSPSQSLALSLLNKQIRPERFLSFDRNDERLNRYLKGETVFLEESEISCLEEGRSLIVAVDGFSLGFAKRTASTLKNLYPKSWRVL